MIETKYNIGDSIWYIAKTEGNSYNGTFDHWDVTTRAKISAIGINITTTGTVIAYSTEEGQSYTEDNLEKLFNDAQKVFEIPVSPVGHTVLVREVSGGADVPARRSLRSSYSGYEDPYKYRYSEQVQSAPVIQAVFRTAAEAYEACEKLNAMIEVAKQEEKRKQEEERKQNQARYDALRQKPVWEKPRSKFTKGSGKAHWELPSQDKKKLKDLLTEFLIKVHK